MIKFAQARALLARAVTTQGRDFVYMPQQGRTCQYHVVTDAAAGDPRSKTGCLVGVALSFTGERRHLGYAGTINGLRNEFPDMLSRKAAQYFAYAQYAQDRSSTWGEAYDIAERHGDELALAEGEGWVSREV